MIAYITILGLIGVFIYFCPIAVRKAKVLYWQHECASYNNIADAVVYEDAPSLAPKLIARSGFKTVSLDNDPTPAAGLVPNCWEQYEHALVLDHSASAAYNSGLNGAVLFLHGRKTLGGKYRIVAIESYSDGARAPRPGCYCVIVRPATFFSPGSENGGRIEGDFELYGVFPPYVRYFAGQADPADQSHFTIRYHFDNRDGILDGWLEDNSPNENWRDPPDVKVRLKYRDISTKWRPSTNPDELKDFNDKEEKLSN